MIFFGTALALGEKTGESIALQDAMAPTGKVFKSRHAFSLSRMPVSGPA